MSRKLLIVIVLIPAETSEAGRMTSKTIARINWIMFAVLEENAYWANAYATIDDAKLNTLTIASNLEFCDESFGTRVA